MALLESPLVHSPTLPRSRHSPAEPARSKLVQYSTTRSVRQPHPPLRLRQRFLVRTILADAFTVWCNACKTDGFRVASYSSRWRGFVSRGDTFRDRTPARHPVALAAQQQQRGRPHGQFVGSGSAPWSRPRVSLSIYLSRPAWALLVCPGLEPGLGLLGRDHHGEGVGEGVITR